MSKERYFELYKQFLDNTISKKDYEELMNWVSDQKNDDTLKRFMDKIWSESYESADKDIVLEASRYRSINFREKIIRISSVPRKWHLAASILLIVTLSFGIFKYLSPDKQTYKTTYAETKHINLEDGSCVILNANSTLTWYKRWNKTGKRVVHLRGEAFFDVKHTLENHPFEVITSDLKVNVLGTTFNVHTRHNKTDVILESGKIKLDLNRENERILEMEPGDRVNFSALDNKLKKSRLSSTKVSNSWHNGILRFEDISVSEVFQKIEELYGKKLITENKELLARRMFTDIPYKDWKIVKEALELALGMTIEEDDNNLYIKY